jgi:hypothetical protein
VIEREGHDCSELGCVIYDSNPSCVLELHVDTSPDAKYRYKQLLELLFAPEPEDGPSA